MTVLHEMSIAHTDIKPDNILLRQDDLVRIVEMSRDGVFSEKVPRKFCHGWPL